jgi:catechol-2,3-dioxygenase
MLGDHPIDVMLLATDLGVAREFYGDKIGLEVLIENDDLLTFKCGGDSRLVVTKSSTGSTEQQTVEGIADVGFALSAWFVDPDGNSIGMLQLKDEEAD